MRNKILSLLVLSFLVCASLFADTILLKSGKTVEGKIIEKTSGSVKLEIEGIPLTYYISDIDSINGQKIAQNSGSSNPTAISSTPRENPSIPEQRKVAATGITTTNNQTPSAGETDLFKEKEVKNEQSEANPENKSYLDYSDSRKLSLNKMAPGQAGIAAGFLAGIFLFMAIFIIVTYIYSAICLSFIAKKTNSGPSFLAWIPFAHHFLRFKIANTSYLWIFIPIGVFIIGLISGMSSAIMGALSGASKFPAAAVNPLTIIINFFLSAVYAAFSGFVWYKIALARNKPSWIGALMAISILNGLPIISFLSIVGCLVIMGYLAFAE